MNNKDLSTTVKIALITALFVFLLLGTEGCVSAPTLTPEEVITIKMECHDNAGCMLAATDKALAEKVAQLEYEAEDRRLTRRDKLIAFLNACDANEQLILVEVIKFKKQLPTKHQQRQAREKYGYAYTHDNVGKHLNQLDVSCMYPTDVFRDLMR